MVENVYASLTPNERRVLLLADEAGGRLTDESDGLDPAGLGYRRRIAWAKRAGQSLAAKGLVTGSTINVSAWGRGGGRSPGVHWELELTDLGREAVERLRLDRFIAEVPSEHDTGR